MNEEQAEPASPRRNQKPLLIMLAVAVLPVVGAYFVFFTGIGMPGQTVNAGKFLEPAVSLEALVSDAQWENIQTEKKWRLVLQIDQSCDEECQSNLYTSRQVHIRLDQRSERMERLAVFSPSFSEDEKQAILKEHPRLKDVSTDSQNQSAWFDSLNIPESISGEYYLLVDQEGRAMMLYDSSKHGNDVLKDIKRAIKYSIDYQ